MTGLKVLKDTYENLDMYCFFAGFPRSGHSLLGSFLNAHHNVVISHELNALKLIEEGISQKGLFDAIMKRDKDFSEGGRQWTEYNYSVGGAHQGNHDKLKVIGDKKGGKTALMLSDNPQLLDSQRSVVQLPMKVVIHLRNPFDNITTISIRREFSLDEGIKLYTKQLEGIKYVMKAMENKDIIVTYHEELLKNPKEVLISLANFLEVDHPAMWLDACQEVLYEKPKKTRTKLVWSQDQTRQITDLVKNNSVYSYYDPTLTT